MPNRLENLINHKPNVLMLVKWESLLYNATVTLTG